MSPRFTLTTIRQRLKRLVFARRAGRWLRLLSVLLAVVLWALALVLALDLLFVLDTFQRLLVMVLTAGGACWLGWRLTRSERGVRETEIDAALLLEHLNGIDTDLVAAIEFARPEAADWGSVALRERVMEDAVRAAPRLRTGQAFAWRPLLEKLTAMAITVLVTAAVWASFPQHMRVYVRRLLLHDDHYPSRTIIAAIDINDRRVLDLDDQLRPRPVRCPEAAPVKVVVRASRHAPDSGELRISARDGSGRRRVVLQRVSQSDVAGGYTSGLFVAELPTLLASLEYQVFLGDAWTRPGTIDLIAWPQLEVRVRVTPPEYAGGETAVVPADAARRVTVMEGSRVDLTVRSSNQKQLRAVSVKLRSAQREETRPLSPDTSDAAWLLDGADCTFLERVVDTVRFSIQATDEDGLSPRSTTAGEILVRADRAPEVAAASIHRRVLPAAQPQLVLHVDDDFGIGQLRLQLLIERGTADGERRIAADPATETHWIELDQLAYPLAKNQLPWTSRDAVDLRPWALRKGDRVQVTLQATDYRGARSGASVTSQPLYWEISDEAGVLSAILEADVRTQQELEEMIARQLGLGE